MSHSIKLCAVVLSVRGIGEPAPPAQPPDVVASDSNNTATAADEVVG